MAVKSAGRVIEIFEFFEQRQKPAPAKEIARTLGYPQSSTSMLLHQLVDVGYLTYDSDSRHYSIAPRLGALGLWAYGPNLQEGRLQHVMTDIADRTGGRVLVGTQIGLAARYLFDICGRDEIHPPHAVYKPRPLASTGVGKLLLSRYSDEEVSRIVIALNARRPANAPPIDRSTLLDELKLIRRNRCATVLGEDFGTVSTFLPRIANYPDLTITVGHRSAVMRNGIREIRGYIESAIEQHLA
jgi:DNA-binding IclR family transcriptional regulator